MAYMNALMRMKVRAVDTLTTGIVWFAVVATAWGAANLAEAIIDTIRYGHPR